MLLCYKGQDQPTPAVKAWLDGARAAATVPRRDTPQHVDPMRPVQCMLTLHRTHGSPSNATVTGDMTTGYSMHLRPVDDTASASTQLKRFIDVCNSGAAYHYGPIAAQHVQRYTASFHPGGSKHDGVKFVMLHGACFGPIRPAGCMFAERAGNLHGFRLENA